MSLGLAELLGGLTALHGIPTAQPAPVSTAKISKPDGKPVIKPINRDRISSVSSAGSVSYGAGRELVPFLGPGITTLVNRITPPTLYARDLFHTISPSELENEAAAVMKADSAARVGPPVSSIGGAARTAAKISTPATKISTTATSLRSTIVGDAVPMTSRVAVPIRTVATACTNRASNASAAFVVAGTPRLTEDSFLTALLQIPTQRIAGEEVLGALWAMVEGGGRGATGEGRKREHRRITVSSLPVETPRRLLPAIPRPSFEHFFGSATGAAVDVTAWPATWADYHGTMAALLLEEARAMLANKVLEAARRLSKGDSSKHAHRQEPQRQRAERLVCGIATASKAEKFRSIEDRADAGSIIVFSIEDAWDPSAPTSSLPAKLSTPHTKDLVLVQLLAADGTTSGADMFLGVVIPPRGSHTAKQDVWLRVGASEVTHWISRRCIFIGLDNISPTLQIYQSVLSMAYSPFAGLVLRPGWAKPVSKVASPDTIPPRLYAALQKRFDTTQLRAITCSAAGGAYQVPCVEVGSADGSILSALRQSGGKPAPRSYCEVTSIIGPPGTGKTRTILGIISAVRACSVSAAPADSSYTSCSGDAKRARTDGHERYAKKKKILVCAASNAAVDEIVARLLAVGTGREGVSDVADMGGGLLDEVGCPFVPNVVRIGAGAASSVRSGVADRSLDSLCHDRLRVKVSAMSAGKRARKTGLSAGTHSSSKLYYLQRRLDSIISEAESIYSREGTAVSSPPRAGAPQFLGVSPNRASRHHLVRTPSGREFISAQVQRYHDLMDERKDLEAEIAFVDDSDNLGLDNTQIALLRQEAMHDVLMEADVIASTLAGAANLLLYRGTDKAQEGRSDNYGSCWKGLTFEAIIIDEAGQAIEAETLIPLKLCFAGYVHTVENTNTVLTTAKLLNMNACRRLILVGDPLQLPATVLSRSSALCGMDISFFERICAAGIQPILLTTQYRMHGSISAFSSSFFYKGLVKDAITVDAAPPRYDHACANTLLLLDVPYGQENFKHHTSGKDAAGDIVNDASYGNDEEVAAIAAFVRHLSHDRIGATGTIGIITPYREQVRRLKEAMRHADIESSSARRITISTVDSFQGQELDTIIISCVRSRSAGSAAKGIGFLSDPRRLNVAVTRARKSLVIVGNSSWLAANDPTWNALLGYMKSHGMHILLQRHAPRFSMCSISACPHMEWLLHDGRTTPIARMPTRVADANLALPESLAKSLAVSARTPEPEPAPRKLSTADAELPGRPDAIVLDHANDYQDDLFSIIVGKSNSRDKHAAGMTGGSRYPFTAEALEASTDHQPAKAPLTGIAVPKKSSNSSASVSRPHSPAGEGGETATSTDVLLADGESRSGSRHHFEEDGTISYRPGSSFEPKRLVEDFTLSSEENSGVQVPRGMHMASQSDGKVVSTTTSTFDIGHQCHTRGATDDLAIAAAGFDEQPCHEPGIIAEHRVPLNVAEDKAGQNVLDTQTRQEAPSAVTHVSAERSGGPVPAATLDEAVVSGCENQLPILDLGVAGNAEVCLLDDMQVAHDASAPDAQMLLKGEVLQAEADILLSADSQVGSHVCTAAGLLSSNPSHDDVDDVHQHTDLLVEHPAFTDCNVNTAIAVARDPIFTAEEKTAHAPPAAAEPAVPADGNHANLTAAVVVVDEFDDISDELLMQMAGEEDVQWLD